MREVTFVGSNGSELVLLASDGEKLTLSVDEQLRAAVRLAPSSKASTEITPREIQDAVRAGATVSEIVASSGADEDFVSKFATPVLEELAHMVSLALSVRVEVGQDRFNESQFAEFGELIADRLRGAHGSNLYWTAHRETPTTWLIKAMFTTESGQGSAVWTFDPRKFSLTPEDATAISLGNNKGIGDRPIPAAVSLHPANGTLEEAKSVDDEATLLDAFRARREAAAALEVKEEPATEVQTADATTEHAPEPTTEALDDSAESPAKRGRAPMPSWDEIVFGAKSDD